MYICISAISHPIYEMQENSIAQISVNVYMQKIFQIFLHSIKLARSKVFMANAHVWISFEQKNSVKCCLHLPLKQILK